MILRGLSSGLLCCGEFGRVLNKARCHRQSADDGERRIAALLGSGPPGFAPTEGLSIPLPARGRMLSEPSRESLLDSPPEA